jgi:trans-AT polyketide synthase, acyltransferase and oxidoreductase domains
LKGSSGRLFGSLGLIRFFGHQTSLPRKAPRSSQEGQITAEEAALAPRVPVASDLCVTGDAGGATDMGTLGALLPSLLRLKAEAARAFAPASAVRVGAAGGIGTPEAVASPLLPWGRTWS